MCRGMIKPLEGKDGAGFYEATLRLTTDQAIRLYRLLMNDRGGIRIKELRVSDDEFDHDLTIRLACESPPDASHNPLHEVIARFG